MMRRNAVILIILVTLAFIQSYLHPFYTVAQQTGKQIYVEAYLDAPSIRIGEQTQLHIIVQSDGNIKELDLPVILATEIPGIEVVELSGSDTSIQDGAVGFTIHQRYLITSFDTGQHQIPAFLIKLGSGADAITSQSNPLYLDVQIVPIEPGSEIRDIKDIQDLPWTFQEALPWILSGLALLLVLGLSLYLFQRWRKGKPLVPLFKKLVLPPHTIALNEFEELRRKKLWQQGRIKEYHSELTNILRKYIEGRFDIPALEMVTHDTLIALESHAETLDHVEEIKQILQLADLVKFAREEPLPDAHEKSFHAAIQFVKSTIPVPIEVAGQEKKDNPGIHRSNESTK